MSFRILESDAQIERMILREIAREVNRSFSRLKTKALGPIRQAIRSSLSSHPTISSLSGGKLRGDFGIPSGVDVVSAIIESVTSSVDMTVVPVTAGRGVLKGGITLTAQPSDYMNVLSLPTSTVVTEKGEVLPWLDWLLLKGDTIIVARYGVKYKGGTGRSGQATMKLNYNAPYKVDSQFSGTSTNNFITESIESANNEIMAILARYI
tara:strand:+ start:251 stop:874 length:624 start_codon:yes stop_codon:yes gene_type:complete